MILKSVRVKNFRCIEDSGSFSVGPVTCLVGKNESGKSAILQSLYKLNPVTPEDSTYSHVEEYPRHRMVAYEERLKDPSQAQPDTAIETIWELEAKEQDAIRSAFGPHALKSTSAKIIKGYDNVRYWSLELDEQAVVSHYVNTSQLDLVQRSRMEEASTVTELMSRLHQLDYRTPAQTELLETLKETFGNLTCIQLGAKVLTKFLPKFIYFADYQKMPGRIAINTLQRKVQTGTLDFSEQIFMALLSLSGTSLEELKNIQKFESFIARMEAVSNRISQEIFEYWSQNQHLNVEFRIDQGRPEDPPPFNVGEVFRTRVKDTRHRVSVSFDHRSSGFVWFFSFLIWFSQVKSNYGENLIILLDEPGLGLHAKAQADLLRYINDKLRPNHQVFYTTHSAFMIDMENLINIRTVEDDALSQDPVEGTTVREYALGSPPDIILPLHAAIGLKRHLLLVASPAERLYLRWASDQLKSAGRTSLDRRWRVVPSGGADQIDYFLHAFNGTQADIAILVNQTSDYAPAGRTFTPSDYVPQQEATLEDLLGRRFYINLVNNCYGLKGQKELPDAQPINAAKQVAVEVANHFARLKIGPPHFALLPPAEFLVQTPTDILAAYPDFQKGLNQFEKLFKALNHLLPQTQEAVITGQEVKQKTALHS